MAIKLQKISMMDHQSRNYQALLKTNLTLSIHRNPKIYMLTMEDEEFENQTLSLYQDNHFLDSEIISINSSLIIKHQLIINH